MRLVFCGTPEFAVPTLEAVLNASHTVDLVLSQPDRPSGRGLEIHVPPVKRFAQQHGLPVAQPNTIRKNPELQARLEEISPDAILVVAYGRLIPAWMLALPHLGNLNLHASLLPKYRGAAPIQWAVAGGERETGVTTMRIDEGLDTGDILLQARVPISQDQTTVELTQVLAAIGATLMVRTLAGLADGILHPTPQDHDRATLAPILRREDGRVDWDRTATEIYNRWRGFQPWPGTFCFFRGKKLVLHVLDVDADVPKIAAPPGMLVRRENRLSVACGDGAWLNVRELQIEGKRRMPVNAFLNGLSLASGERLD